MNVVIIHQHFNDPYSGGPLRSYYLATALVKAGHQVTVVTGRNTDTYTNVVVDNIDVHYLPVPYHNRFGFYQRGRSFISFVQKATKLVTRLPKVDVCYAISVPITVGIVAMRLQKQKHIPFIFEVGDLWPDAPIELGFIRNPLLKWLLLKLERRIYQRSQSVVALSPAIREGILKKSPQTVVHMIPNMADTSFYHPSTRPDEKLFTIAYIGALGYANGLEYLLSSARACLAAEIPVQFIMCGDGGERAKVEDIIRIQNLKNVQLLPFTNREGVNAIFDRSDAVFISYRPAKILETGSPNKYFDGLAAGKLIIINFHGWIEDELVQNGAGFFTDPLNGDDLVDKIRPIMQSPELLTRYQKAARQLAEEKYSRSILSSKFMTVIDSIGK